jgi:hypothetical protein
MTHSLSSPMIKRSYSLGSIGHRILEGKNIISMDNLKGANTLSSRYSGLVTAYKEKRKELFDKFIKRYLRKEQSDHAKLFNSFSDNLKS